MKLKELKEFPEETIDMLEEVIDSLIFANMKNSVEPLELTLNYGMYVLIFKGKPENSLRDALNFFKCEIAIIKGGKRK